MEAQPQKSVAAAVENDNFVAIVSTPLIPCGVIRLTLAWDGKAALWAAFPRLKELKTWRVKKVR